MEEYRDLTLEEKHISLMSDYEVTDQLFMGTMQDDLVYLAKKGEIHAIADVLYFWGNKENENISQRHLNCYRHYLADPFNAIINSQIVKDIKMKYLHSPYFLKGDEYLVLAQVVATDQQRDEISYYAAKTYLEDLKEYNNCFSGAMFIKILEQNAEITSSTIKTCPVAELIKKYLLWGDEKQRNKLFDKLIIDVKKLVVKQAKHKDDFRSKFAYAYVLKKEGLKRRERISPKSFEIFLNLSNKYGGSITEEDADFVKIGIDKGITTNTH